MAGTAMTGGRISAVTMDLSLLEQILCYLYYHGLSSPSRMRWRSDAAATNAAYQAIDGLYASWAGVALGTLSVMPGAAGQPSRRPLALRRR